MKRRWMLPPTYFLLSIAIMVALHFLLPVRKAIFSPYNFFGILLIPLGLLINIWSGYFFKRIGTALKPFEQSSYLVTEGLYRFSRNPMYLGMVLVLIGLAVLLGTITPVLVIPIFIWVITKIFIGIEEKMLEERFGADYLEYKKRVRRWI